MCVCVSVGHTRPSRLRNRCACLRIRLYASQQRSTKSWKRLDGLSPPLMTNAMSEVKTKGARSLQKRHDRVVTCKRGSAYGSEKRRLLSGLKQAERVAAWSFRVIRNTAGSSHRLMFPNICACPRNFPKSMWNM